MKHIKVIPSGNNVRLIPTKGYSLYNTITNTTYSDAEVSNKQVGMFVAIEEQ